MTLTRRQLEVLAGLVVSGEARTVPSVVWERMLGDVPPPSFESNGCGPKLAGTRLGRAVSRMVPDGLHEWSFLAPCHYHDYAYAVGGAWRDRRRADWHLAMNILTVMAMQGGTASAFRAFGIALCYWVAVRAGGWCAWRYGSTVRPMGRWGRRWLLAAHLPLRGAQLLVEAVRRARR